MYWHLHHILDEPRISFSLLIYYGFHSLSTFLCKTHSLCLYNVRFHLNVLYFNCTAVINVKTKHSAWRSLHWSSQIHRLFSHGSMDIVQWSGIQVIFWKQSLERRLTVMMLSYEGMELLQRSVCLKSCVSAYHFNFPSWYFRFRLENKRLEWRVKMLWDLLIFSIWWTYIFSKCLLLHILYLVQI